VPIGLAVDGASRHDMRLVEATRESIPVDQPKPTQAQPRSWCLDKLKNEKSRRDLFAPQGQTALPAVVQEQDTSFQAIRWMTDEVPARRTPDLYHTVMFAPSVGLAWQKTTP